MTKQATETEVSPDQSPEVAETLQQLQGAFARWVNEWSQKVPTGVDPAALQTLSFDPQKVLQAQWSLWQSQQALWLQTTAKLLGTGAEGDADIATAEKGDRRFKDETWSENPLFSHLKQSYLLNAKWMQELFESLDNLAPEMRRSLEFCNQQVIDALAPTNFALTNPVVLRATHDTQGQNLIDGMTNLLRDMEKSQGSLQITQTEPNAFEVGENIAVTPGQIVFQNEFFQLIQYQPSTDKVYSRPLLIVPPWINKYYILDLKPENSFIKWSVEQGFTVFVMSWVNPDESFRDKTFDDYVCEGVVRALDAVESQTGVGEINTVGYCIGGTLLGITLAYLAAKGDSRVTSATFLAAQVDFEEAGCLRVFTGPEQLSMLDEELEKKGYLDGWQMASAFNMLRANDLIWYFVINNYLLGKSPKAFELLHWNADSTRFPAQLLRDYLHNMYQENVLATAGAFNIDGTPVDLSKVTIATYIQATKEDHISPAPSVFKSMHRFAGDRQFVLAGSGHIAGVVNPPSSGRYQHWTNASKESYADVDSWLADAEETAGSWWPHWKKWLAKRSGKKVPARVIKATTIEAAPGSYVRVKS